MSIHVWLECGDKHLMILSLITGTVEFLKKDMVRSMKRQLMIGQDMWIHKDLQCMSKCWLIIESCHMVGIKI